MKTGIPVEAGLLRTGTKNQRILLDHGGAPEGGIRILCDRVDTRQLGEGNNTITVNIARVVMFNDPFYGKVELSRKKFNRMIRNFNEDVYGQEVNLDVAHMPSDGSAGVFKRLFMDRNKFRGEVELTEYGIEAIKKRGFRYLSADYTENYTDPETGKEHGPLLFGAGLTVRPRIKRLDPISLSFDDKPMLISPRAEYLFTQEIETMNEWLKKLKAALAHKNLAENLIRQFCENFETAGKQLGDDEEALQGLYTAFETAGVQLAENLSQEAHTDAITLDFSGLNLQSGGNGISEDDVRRLLAEQQQAADEERRQLEEQRTGNVTLFTRLLSEAEGLQSLSEEDRTQLSEAAELITPEMSEDQVRKLAEHQIALGNRMAVNAQLNNLGYQCPQGTVHISVDDSNAAHQLQEDILTGLRGTASHATGRLSLDEQVNPFIERVLAEFDRINAPRIAHERKLLAGGTTSISDTSLPVGFQRTVIREALSDLRVLDLVQTLTDFGATATTQIPYEVRDTSAVQNDGIVYESQPIHRASVTQAMDLAYILPMKLGFLITNEVMHFSQASQINWDAYGRNVESNARVMRELVVRRICNELQRNADAFGALNITNEGFDAQLDGATVSTVKTVQFPIVRPHQQRDLQGNAVGAAENPITVRLNGAAIAEYDGTGTQPAATYYRITNYNLGYIQFVDQTGAPVTPPNAAGADDISYSYATNLARFDLDNGAIEIGLHLNGLLRTFGARKAVMANDRFVLPDFSLMSYTFNNTATNANNFEVDSKRNGTDTNSQGDLDAIKAVPAFSTNAPGIDLGDERAIMGQRGTLTYTISKPFVTGQPFEAVDANGKALGQKQAYGEEYSAIKVPTPIRNRLTSVLAYSFTAR